MNITINVNIPALEELAGAIHVFSSALAYQKKGSFVDVSNEVAEQKKSSAPVKEETVTPKAEESNKEVTEDTSKVVKEDTKEPSTDESEYIPTVVELRAKAQEKGGTPEGKKAIKSLLDKFNSKSISKVEEKDRAAFLSELEAL